MLQTKNNPTGTKNQPAQKKSKKGGAIRSGKGWGLASGLWVEAPRGFKKEKHKVFVLFSNLRQELT